MVDHLRRWPEAVPYDRGISSSVCQCFPLITGVRFGVPDHITSDRGTIFTSQLWTSLNCLLGTQLHHTTAYHPKSNGMVKRFHRTLKAALVSHCNSSTWYPHLSWVLPAFGLHPKRALTCQQPRWCMWIRS
ncbi:uncharacterized protein [Macrobrachium rosenbergii]|uniref:uncharacterized protein n=1 Tax=Macrobrachium rosenbergii TaxID=79674 RepID=UPI0034D50AA5